MVEPVKLKELFHIEYGNQLDKNKMCECRSGTNFVSRTSANLGVDTKVEAISGVDPYEAGLITATLGGTYLLSAFVQPEEFYTGQNIKVLRPLKQMSFNEKIYYCLAIARNRFRYTSHGREANKTFDDILVPPFSALPNWVNATSIQAPNMEASSDHSVALDFGSWKGFRYDEIFDIERGKGPRKSKLTGHGDTPFITSTDQNNGLTGFTTEKARHNGNVITVNRNGSVGEAFYQVEPFSSTEDVHVLKPKFPLNKYIAIFMLPLFRAEKYRFNYGRKWGLSRMNESIIRLPTKSDGQPDWDFMESYVKTLPYSASL
ncbi:restriction endonuclease subunit S [Sneathiella sp.]|uniref:restriction endonuclease subunit S n=1 Tax=Sneathiella sp. TaxID=1964365 RepID=UPI00356276F4